MGKPKSSNLSCTVCNAKFKKKSLLDGHMEKHLRSTQSRKHTKTYCYTCKKSFDDPNRYKIHIQMAHVSDSSKLNNDIFSCENGFVLLSKRKIKKGMVVPKQQLSLFEKCKFPVVSLTDIKIEPTDKGNEEFDRAEHQNAEDKASKQKNSIKAKISKLKCPVCSMQCKNKKGLKIHMRTHKKASSKTNGSSDKNDKAVNDTQNVQSNNILNVSQFQNQTNNLVNIGNHPNIFNICQFQNHPNNLVNAGNHPTSILSFGNPMNSLMNSTNQTDAQLQSFPFQNVLPPVNIPKFDCNSETYMKWLKNFVAKCKKHDYPLSPNLCSKVSLVTEEITKALGNPKCALKQKANHFYFMNIYNQLTEIMLNHMQHTLCAIGE